MICYKEVGWSTNKSSDSPKVWGIRLLSYKLLFTEEKIFTFYLFTSWYFPIFSYRALLFKETNLV